MSAKSPLRPRYLKLHAALVFAFLFAPIVVLVVFSFNKAKSGTNWAGFSTHWYGDLAHNHLALQAFRNTLKVAFVATLFATIIGTLAGSLQTLAGGNITIFTELCEKTRAEAFDMMVRHAQQMGANAVIGVRWRWCCLSQLRLGPGPGLRAACTRPAE